MTRLSTLSRSIAGSTAVITGAGSGMGRATAHLFADEGATVVIADLDPASVEAVAIEIADVHGPDRVIAVPCDVTDATGLRDLVSAAEDATGRLDIVINNAGVGTIARVVGDDQQFDDSWARTLDVNLTAQVRLVRLALPLLQAAPAGRVVNIASTEAVIADAGFAAYAASKAGVTGLTRSLAVELGPDGITVNCICPGPVRTAMTAPISEEHKQTFARRRVPLGRYGDAEEVAQTTLSLCLPAASFVTGATLCVDGGMSIRNT